jgi:hypothetical protein
LHRHAAGPRGLSIFENKTKKYSVEQGLELEGETPIGGKSEAPEAPDYSELAAASEKSADYAYELAKEQQAWAEQTYYENKATSDIVIEAALGSLERQEQDAAEARERYETLYQPLEEQLVAEAEEYATPERLEYEAGKAEADVAAQFEAARRTAQERLESYGVDPSQTRQGALDLGTRIAEAAAQSSAGNQARDRAEEVARELRAQAINIGRGYPAEISGAESGASSAGTQAANTGLATTASGASTMGTGSQWQGLGNQAIGTWGDVLNTGFQNALSGWQAEQEASSGWGDILGTGLGIVAGKYWQQGGAIPDGRPVTIDASPSRGAIPDDVNATIDGTAPARLNAGEFIVPQDVMKWKGEEWAQKEINRARQQMASPQQRPAVPQLAPPQAQGPGVLPLP